MPDSKVFIQSVLPTNSDYRPDLSNKVICEVNLILDELCKRFGFYYIDFYSDFLDENSNLDMNYSYDGLHLSLKGTSHWRDIIKPYVDGNERPELKIADSDFESMMLNFSDTVFVVPYYRVDIGNEGSCAEFIWTDGVMDTAGWTNLAQIRDGKVIGIFDTFHVAQSEENASAENNNIVMAIIDLTNVEPDDEFMLCDINGSTVTVEGKLYHTDGQR